MNEAGGEEQAGQAGRRRHRADGPSAPRREARIGLPAVGAIMLAMLLAGALAVYRIADPTRPTHVILIVLDTVRADHLGLYGYERDTMPRLRRFADRGIVFEEARASAPWTLPSHASLFTGRLPFEHGCHWEHRTLVPSQVTICEALHEKRPVTECIGITTNVNASSLYGLDQGFDRFLETWKLRGRYPGLDDSSILHREVERWLDERDDSRPFFLFLNFSDAHLPYTPPAEYASAFGTPSPRARELAADPNLLERVMSGTVQVDEELGRDLALLYDQELRALDDRIGHLLDLLARHGVLRDALVIITSDHGEFLGEAGLVDHQLSLREELLHVPLIVGFEGRVVPARLSLPTPLTQVFDWVLAAASGQTPEWEPVPDAHARGEGVISEYHVPVDLLDRLRTLGVDTKPFESRRFAVRAYDSGPALKLVGETGQPKAMYVLDETGEDQDRRSEFKEEVSRLHSYLIVERVSRRFREDPGDLIPAPTAADVAEDMRQLEKFGYFQDVRDGVSVHAVEHWSAGVRHRARGDLEDAAADLRNAASLAPGFAPILLELAQVLDEDGVPEAAAAYDRYLDAARSDELAPTKEFRTAEERRRSMSQEDPE